MEERIGLTNILFVILMGILLVSVPVPALAKVTGQCAQCHTMHNSQGGTPMAVDILGAAQDAPNETLLRFGCVACHTGTNDGTNNIPYVNKTTEPTYGVDGTTGETLAGGNFYWVAKVGNPGGLADATGHNVASDGLANQDATLGFTPPGSTGTYTSQLTCAGTAGCHGDRTKDSDFGAMSGTHHADDSVIDGTSVVRSYRFLDGVLGLEDPGWEYQPTAALHNQYQGYDRTADTELAVGSISNLCSQCHNDFHNGSGNVGGTAPTAAPFASPWVRHPTDFDMGNTATGSEYRSYGGGTNYVVSTPVASVDVTTVLQTVTFSNDTIVTCISCHRAHGTPYDDLLRWDYSGISAGGGGTGGCFECHTTKN